MVLLFMLIATLATQDDAGIPQAEKEQESATFRKINMLLATEHVSNVDALALSKDIDNHVAEEDKDDIIAMAWQETRFLHRAIGSQGERGILQVHPLYHPEYDRDSLMTMPYGLKAGYEVYVIKFNRDQKRYSGSSAYPESIKRIKGKMGI